MVHPALGRIAMLLEPEGVKLHWITDRPASEANGLPPDNAVAVEGERLGPKQLPLKPDAWNRLEIALDDATAELTLNDVPIYRHALRPEDAHVFGLFHYKNLTAVAVRDVVLRGDWPERLSPEQMVDPTVRTVAKTLKQRRAADLLTDEKVMLDAVDHVLLRARRMPVEQRYEHLRAWVLPPGKSYLVRFYGAFAAPPLAHGRGRRHMACPDPRTRGHGARTRPARCAAGRGDEAPAGGRRRQTVSRGGASR